MGACVCRGKLDGGKLNRVIDRKYWGLSLRRSLDAGSRRQSSMGVGSGLGNGNGWTEITSTKSMDGVGDGGVGLPEPCVKTACLRQRFCGFWSACEEGQDGLTGGRTKPMQTLRINGDWVEDRMVGLEPLQCMKYTVLADNIFVGKAYRGCSLDPVKKFVFSQGQR